MVYVDTRGYPDIDEENEAAYRFTTYKNYIANFRDFLFGTYGEGKSMLYNLKGALEEIRNYKKIQGRSIRNTQTQTVNKLLYNAWHTELMIILSGQYGEYVRYSNHWSSVQAYYAIFLALQALFESAGMQRQNNHSYALTAVSNLIKQRRMFPLPWCVYCTGSPELNEEKCFNLPVGVSISKISSLSVPKPERFWNNYGMLLRTTREKQFVRRANEWKKKRENYIKGRPRKKLSTEQKRSIYNQMHPTTFFDVLYRLRIRSNYQDADSYILGTLSDYDAETYHNSIKTVTRSTLFLLEMYIAAYIGRITLTSIMDSFIVGDKHKLSKRTIGIRKEIIEG